MTNHLENMNDDIKPYPEPPPRWFSIGCLITIIAIVYFIVRFFVRLFGG